MKKLACKPRLRSVLKKSSLLMTAVAASLVVSLSAQAGKIISVPAAPDALGFIASGFGGLNLDNVDVVLNGNQDVIGTPDSSWFDPAGGSYCFAPDSDFT